MQLPPGDEVPSQDWNVPFNVSTVASLICALWFHQRSKKNRHQVEQLDVDRGRTKQADGRRSTFEKPSFFVSETHPWCALKARHYSLTNDSLVCNNPLNSWTLAPVDSTDRSWFWAAKRNVQCARACLFFPRLKEGAFRSKHHVQTCFAIFSISVPAAWSRHACRVVGNYDKHVHRALILADLAPITHSVQIHTITALASLQFKS